MLPAPIDASATAFRPVSEGMDKILGLRFPVLDKGWVSPVDYMGNDRTPAHAARTSTKGFDAEQDRSLEADVKLLSHLYRERHTSPFEACECRIIMYVPIVVLRQIMRHRTFSYNEQSGRYSVFDLEFYYPEVLHPQSTTNKQMADEDKTVEHSKQLLERMKAHNEEFKELYEGLLCDLTAREQARLNMPLNTYTVVSMKGNLLNWIKFLSLRTAYDAQPETRQYALMIENILTAWVPNIMEIRKTCQRL